MLFLKTVAVSYLSLQAGKRHGLHSLRHQRFNAASPVISVL